MSRRSVAGAGRIITSATSPPGVHHHVDLKATVRKTFKLNIEGKNRDRLLDAVKHDIRKYVKRQRRVPLPEGVDFWDFECRFGLSEALAEVVHFATLLPNIDAAAKEGADSFYVELLVKAAHRRAKPVVPQEDDAEAPPQS